jgi:hypothetical protein
LAWIYSSRSPQALAFRPVYRRPSSAGARSTAATIFQNREDKQRCPSHMGWSKRHKSINPGSGVDIEVVSDDCKLAVADGIAPQIGLANPQPSSR